MNRKILAFVHINKAAGTTLTHVLRINFFMRHVDVQALSKPFEGVFEPVDMKKIIIINPFVRSIAGHAVKPFSDLSDAYPAIRYITLLRDPIQRTISHYQYSIEKHRANFSFDDYLEMPASLNRQTQAIAGSEDISLAKKIILRRFLLVGIVEKFDEFLILLKKKLEPSKFRAGYKMQNVAKIGSPVRADINQQFDRYHQKIIERNLLDIELYNYIKNEVLPKERKAYGSTFEHDVAQFKKLERGYAYNLLIYLDYVCRKCYYKPAFTLIRKVNRLN